jgi:hypothetical protein
MEESPQNIQANKATKTKFTEILPSSERQIVRLLSMKNIIIMVFEKPNKKNY